jgi:magnesium-transporting ATPase (P-type)
MNLCACGVSMIGPFVNIDAPVTVVQMLWINLIMDTLAALAFAGEAPLERYMREPPTPRWEPVLNGDMVTRIFSMGIYCVMLCLWFLQSKSIELSFGGRESAEFASGFFALFVFCAVFGAFFARSGRVNFFAGLLRNRAFVAVIGAVFLAQIVMIYFGGSVLRCAPLSAEQLKTVICYALTVIPVGILLEAAMRVRFKGKKKRLSRSTQPLWF